MGAYPGGTYASPSDLSERLSPATYLAIFDDANAGFVLDDNPTVVLFLKLAHVEVTSYLQANYEGIVPAELPSTVSFLLKSAELDYAVSLSLERRPEYERTYGEKARAELWKRAETRMERIIRAIQRVAPNDTPPAAKPQNVGGFSYDTGPRLITPNADGTQNGGDF